MTIFTVTYGLIFVQRFGNPLSFNFEPCYAKSLNEIFSEYYKRERCKWVRYIVNAHWIRQWNSASAAMYLRWWLLICLAAVIQSPVWSKKHWFNSLKKVLQWNIREMSVYFVCGSSTEFKTFSTSLPALVVDLHWKLDGALKIIYTMLHGSLFRWGTLESSHTLIPFQNTWITRSLSNTFLRSHTF